MGYFVKNRSAGRSPEGVVIAPGDTLNRPFEPKKGSLRFNTDTNTMEFYNGINYESIVTPGAVTIIVDNFIGDGIVSSYSMTQIPTDEKQIMVFVGGLHQEPITAYTILNEIITFTEPPPLNSPISIVHNIGKIG